MNPFYRRLHMASIAALGFLFFTVAFISACSGEESDSWNDLWEEDPVLPGEDINIPGDLIPGEYDLLDILPEGTHMLPNGNYILPGGAYILPDGACFSSNGTYLGDISVELSGKISLPEGWNGTRVTDPVYDLKDTITEGPDEMANIPSNISVVGDSANTGPIQQLGAKAASVPTQTAHYFSSSSRTIARGTSRIVVENLVRDLPFPGSEYIPMPVEGMDSKTAAGVGAVSFSVMLLTALFYGSGKHGAAFLVAPVAYTRLKRENILRHEVRNSIFEEVARNPGVNLLSLKQKLDLKNGVLAYHVATLERENFIKSHRDGRLRRLYLCGYKVSTLSAVQQDVLNIIAESSSVSQKAIADRLKVSKQTVNYHIRKLEKMGMIAVKKEGRECRCILLRRGS